MTDRRLIALVGAASVAALAGAAVAVLFWSSHGIGSNRPPCTAGASSIVAGGKAHTTWYPKGCSHP